MLRSIEEEARKLSHLPDADVYDDPVSYTTELFRRIENGFNEDEILTEEEKEFEKEQDMEQLKEAIGILSKFMNFKSRSESSESEEEQEVPKTEEEAAEEIADKELKMLFAHIR
jgi:hypothetical protein